jgi:hypothetical protein
MLTILFKPFGLRAPKTFKLFGFPTFRFWAYMMIIIPETRRAHWRGLLYIFVIKIYSS